MRRQHLGVLIGIALVLVLPGCGEGGAETTTATRPGRDAPRTLPPRDSDAAPPASSVATIPAGTPAEQPASTITVPRTTDDIATVPTSTVEVTAPQPSPNDCPAADGSAPAVSSFDEPPPMCIDPARSYTAVIVTNHGTMSVVLDAIAAPVTVNNFVVLARYHYFDATVCHRIITDFIVQCGDPTATGSGGPGYEFADELPASSDLYVPGSVSMANAGPGTNGSQFFFATSPSTASSLQPDYSIFGQVAPDGFATLEVLNQIGSDGSNGTPTRSAVQIESVTITES